MNSIMIAGTSSGVGKTTVAMGLMAALSETMSVQPFKVGPDYIDPAFHSFITGRVCRNLDTYLLQPPMVNHLFCKNMEGADIGIIEGVMGLYDGAGVTSDIGSSASVAKLLKVPVILVVDGAKVAGSIAATVKGFELFDDELQLAGVLFNNVSGEAHYQILKKAVEHHTSVRPIGYLKKNPDLTMPERHLGLVPACEHQDLRRIFDVLAASVRETVDIDAILEMAGQSKAADEGFIPAQFNEEKVRIGIARDKAFNFYYQDALDLLQDYGAVEWVPFSPLEADRLPEGLDALYIGGGFPEMFACELDQNRGFMDSLREGLEAGLPYAAECGGLMYLCDTLVDLEGAEYRMVGWLDGRTTMTKRLQRFGYAELTIDETCVYGCPGDSIRVHEFHRSSAEVQADRVYTFKKYRDGECLKEWQCGYRKGKGVAAYAHLHFAGNLSFGENFVKAAVDYKNREV